MLGIGSIGDLPLARVLRRTALRRCTCIAYIHASSINTAYIDSSGNSARSELAYNLASSIDFHPRSNRAFKGCKTPVSQLDLNNSISFVMKYVDSLEQSQNLCRLFLWETIEQICTLTHPVCI
jgi:hypothetical protein